MNEPIDWQKLTPNERDALVAEKIMGWDPNVPCDGAFFSTGPEGDGVNMQCLKCGIEVHWGETAPKHKNPPALPYTRSIHMAWDIVERLRKDRFDVHVASAPFQYDVAILDRRKGSVSFEASAATAPEAICLAALKVVGVEVKNHE